MPSNPIISQNTPKMPSSESFFINSPIFASGVVKVADALNSQAYLKSKKIFTVHSSQSHDQTWTQNTTAETFPNQNRIHKDQVTYFFPSLVEEEVLFTCSPHARWLGYYITYESAVHQKHAADPTNLRPAKISLSLISLPRSTRTVVDAGCSFAFVDGLLENSFREATDYNYSTNTTTLVNQHYDSESKVISSGYLQTLPPDGISYSSITTPRPLFIPTTARGLEIAVKVTTEYVRLNSITIFEMFEDVAL